MSDAPQPTSHEDDGEEPTGPLTIALVARLRVRIRRLEVALHALRVKADSSPTGVVASSDINAIILLVLYPQEEPR